MQVTGSISLSTVNKLVVSAKEAAELLSISRAQFCKLHSSGKVPLPVPLGQRCPRWRVDELRDWLAAGAPDRATWERGKKEKRNE